MTATRFILVLLVLGTVASDGYSQLLRRRREATWKAIEPEVQRQAADFTAKAISDAYTKALTEMYNEVGFVFEFHASLEVFAVSQIDPELFKLATSKKDEDINQAVLRKVCKELSEKGAASVFLAETARFAEKLKSENFSTPVLQKIYLEYEEQVTSTSKDRPGEGSQPTSREIVVGQFLLGKAPPEEKGGRRVVMCYESPKQKDPKNKSLFTVHSSFVFTVQKEGKESQKTLSLDLNLEEMKPKEGTSAFPWKAANVQYK